ncbi:hypothetical protein AB0I87_13540 [Streptomyces sp. NPDC049952]|uniref:hypothetical protein n=1 Tax=Streptomyces sp. NPDC049952 TaxID=3156665 RepID=UPI00343DD582
MAYATEAEFAEFLAPDAPPAQARRLLETASALIDELLIWAVYAVDEQGKPSAPAVADVFAKAVCHQAQYMAATGDETGAHANVSSMSQGGLSITRALGSKSTSSARTPRHSENAVGVLRGAGVLPIGARTDRGWPWPC